MAKRKVEVFTSGCFLCDEAVKVVKDTACPNCDVTIYDLAKDGAKKARAYGIHSVPAVVVDGKVLECCSRGKVTKEALQAAGVGR